MTSIWNFWQFSWRLRLINSKANWCLWWWHNWIKYSLCKKGSIVLRIDRTIRIIKWMGLIRLKIWNWWKCKWGWCSRSWICWVRYVRPIGFRKLSLKLAGCLKLRTKSMPLWSGWITLQQRPTWSQFRWSCPRLLQLMNSRISWLIIMITRQA